MLPWIFVNGVTFVIFCCTLLVPLAILWFFLVKNMVEIYREGGNGPNTVILFKGQLPKVMSESLHCGLRNRTLHSVLKFLHSCVMADWRVTSSVGK